MDLNRYRKRYDTRSNYDFVRRPRSEMDRQRSEMSSLHHVMDRSDRCYLFGNCVDPIGSNLIPPTYEKYLSLNTYKSLVMMMPYSVCYMIVHFIWTRVCHMCHDHTIWDMEFHGPFSIFFMPRQHMK